MIFALDHGSIYVPHTTGSAAESALQPEPGLCKRPDQVGEPSEAESGFQSFGYFDVTPSNTAPVPAAAAAALDQLGNAMAEQAGGNPLPEADRLPAILTYFGQFVDHDITAGTDTDANIDKVRIGRDVLAPIDKSLAVTAIGNARKGFLELDSVYGDGPGQTPEIQRLEVAMRADDGIRMRVGRVTDIFTGAIPFLRPPLPAPPSAGELPLADLPRVGTLVDEGVIEIDDLPEAFRPVPGDNDRWRRRALIGDGRNDENLVVAQFHVAVLRFHNAVADWLDSNGGATFEKARRLTRFHYQWLVAEQYLPAISDPETLADVKAQDVPIYRTFQAARRPGAMPFEFSTAGFRFGHSMIREAYDFNRNFTFGNSSPTPATLSLLFQFTGQNPATPIGQGHDTLPDNWIIEWDRLLGRTAQQAARPIDTALAPTTLALPNVGETGFQNLFKHLARRNLRRGFVLALPTAQQLTALWAEAGFPLRRLLAPAEIAGDAGQLRTAVVNGGFDTATPLWFYVLREAEVLHKGARLGPLGTRIVAETLLGLLRTDPAGFVAADWTPAQGVTLADGAPVDGFRSFLEFAGVS